MISLAASDPFIAVGGLNGELLIGNSAQDTLVVDEVLSDEITTFCQFYKEQGQARLLVCSNDHTIRLIDPEVYSASKVLNCSAAVNHASLSSDLKLVAAAVDLDPAFVISAADGTTVMALEGHKDYNFATGWHPQYPHILATGSQDLTVKLWDLRNGGQAPLTTLQCNIGSCRSLKFTGDGEFLVFTESADFIHIVDAELFMEEQVLDLFGDISGFAFDDEFCPDRLYVGVADPDFRSLVEFRKKCDGFGLSSLSI
jgi:WD40 repeat protein